MTREVPWCSISATTTSGSSVPHPYLHPDLYRHFPTKETLLEAVMVDRVQDLLADARARADAPDPGAAFFGLMARISDEVAAKRDISDALGDATLDSFGQLAAIRDDLHAAFGAPSCATALARPL